MGLGEFPVAPGGAMPHHGKAKIQKLPPEKRFKIPEVIEKPLD
jgi:hypothetical protein